MAHTLTESSTFTASVIVPDDGETATAASVETALQALANRTAYLNDNKVTGPASATDNAIARFDATTGKVVQNSGASVDDSANLVTTGEYTYATAKSRTVSIHPWAVRTSTGWTINSVGKMVASTNSAQLFIPLPKLPHGSQITQVDVYIGPGAARSGPFNNMQVDLVEYTLDTTTFGVPTASDIFQAFDNGSIGSQVVTMDLSGAPHTVDSEKPLYIMVQAGNTAAINNDEYYGAQITFSDPGPRNY